MNKAQLVEQLATEVELTKADCERLIDNTIEIMVYEDGNIRRIMRLDSINGKPQMFREYDREHGIASREQETYTYENGKIAHVHHCFQRQAKMRPHRIF